MDKGLRNAAGIAMMAAGFALASWLVFGAPQSGQDDGWRLVRMALGMTAMGTISGGARLIFWGPKGERDGFAGESVTDRA
ncbi:hypothetical protein [Streptomyces sp. NPDC015125]|uniref:hypothetical protein n=1 Tax=Streptomyces sp. NPDC015125 TaxID=3364938 RepID=UPI0037001200